MALDREVGSFVADVAGGTQTINLVQSITPKCLILECTGLTATGWGAGNQFARGMSDGVNEGCFCGTSEDNQDTSDCDQRAATKVITLLDFTQTVVMEGHVLNPNGFGAGWFKIVWDTPPTAPYIIRYTVLGGADLTDVALQGFASPADVGLEDLTGFGFNPQGSGRSLALFISGGVDPTATTTHCAIGIGAAKSATERGAVCGTSVDAMDFIFADTWHESAYALMVPFIVKGAPTRFRVDFDSWIADGLRVDFVDDPNSQGYFFCMVLDGPQFDVVVDTTPNGVGVTQHNHDAFLAKLAGIFHWGAVGVGSSPRNDNVIHSSAADGTRQGGIVVTDDAAVDMTNADQRIQDSKALEVVVIDRNIDVEATHDSFVSGGVRLNYSNINPFVDYSFVMWVAGDAPAVVAAAARPHSVVLASGNPSIY